MIIKGIDDIRLLRSTHPRIATQMKNLEPYNLVSNQPSISRDLSIVTGIDTDIEDICENIVKILGKDTELLESVEILSDNPYHELTPQVVQRLGIQPNQKNLLLRMTLRSLHTSISNQQANILMDLVYQQIHQGNC